MSGSLTVRLLGPFEVAEGGPPVALTTGRLRALLATLAMSAGRPVPVDQLAEAVWDEAPPADVRRSLTTYVTRLRATLGGSAIKTTPFGYALQTAPDDVDALRLLRLAGDPHRRTGAADREALDAALRLWRGTPFEGVPSRRLASTRAPGLVEAYLAVAERRIDLDIGRARHAGLVAELTELTCRYPLRESLWLRLLVVLDRSGCPAEALARYERMRAHLAEELGVDPGRELQRAYADLLAGRPPSARGPGGVAGYTTDPGVSPLEPAAATGQAEGVTVQLTYAEGFRS